ncbi:gliding motility-associated C-terminal domain-containing protein [Crocinitomix catalasitica]|nr:gliding motility-associated C-terminal domain-containing protein [Crocinitomix catalasitica]MBN4071109.1 gliding motility-associated C-terminal domain-containing protein [Crocinitomix catalasitica]
MNIEELFKQQFEGFESNVSPEVWTNISQSIGSTAVTTAVTGGLSTFAKVAIISGGVIVASVTGSLILDPPSENNETIIPTEETTVEDNSQNDKIVSIIYVKDENDSAVNNNKEEIAKAIEDNMLEEMIVPEELVEEILHAAEDKAAQVMIFDMIIDRGQNPQKVNADSHNEIIVAGTEKNKIEESNENKKKDEVVVQTINEDKENIVVDLEKEELIADEECIVAANVITIYAPDGINDYWTIETKDIQTLAVQLVDKKGNTIFTSNDKNFRWDGTDRFGEQVEKGVYTYIIVAKRNNGKKLVIQGSVNVY